VGVVVELEGEKTAELVMVRVPRALPRIIRFSKSQDGADFAFLGGIIRHHVHTLVNDAKVKGAHLFRVTRNSNLYYEEEEAHNLLNTIEAELRNANRGAAVRLEVQEDCPPHLVKQLQELFVLEDEDVYRCPPPLNLLRLMPLCFEIDRPDLRDKNFTPNVVVASDGDTDIFHSVRRGDILLHHPYDSFQTVVDLITQAASDPAVLAIKQTLYRTSSDSPLVHALIVAAQNGKQVTVIIELKARFDEAANIHWAKALEEAGVHVVYGIPGLKTHVKAILVARREGNRVREYVHIGTGNYNPKTARLYTDLGLFTADPDIGADVAEMFNFLTGYGRPAVYRKVLVSPTTMRDRFIGEIERTVAAHEAGEEARIALKMNSLVDAGCIRALYAASQAGVRIDLNVRGICCLRPGVEGISDNIRVVSIVGRFLEHSRVYSFQRGEETRVLMGSADIMPRNLDSRVELVAPVEDPELRAEMLDVLERCFADDENSWELGSDGLWTRNTPGEGGGRSVQRELRELYAARAAEQLAAATGDLREAAA